jgi:hypothetical protein
VVVDLAQPVGCWGNQLINQVGIFRTEYFGALRFIRDAAGRLAHRPEAWDRPTGPILPHVLFELDDWRKRISANEPCLITAHDEAPEWIFVTDASKARWAGAALHVPQASYTFTHTIGHQNSPGPNIRRRLSPGRSTTSSAKP